MSYIINVLPHLYNGPYVYWKNLMESKKELHSGKKKLQIDDVLAIGDVLKTNNTLTELYLSSNNITDVSSIGDALKTNNTLTKLELHNNHITDVQSIGEGLKSNNTLKILTLYNNYITDDGGIQSIIEALKTNNTLKTLRLQYNELSETMKSQLEAVQQYKRHKWWYILYGYEHVEDMVIQTFYSNKIKLRF